MLCWIKTVILSLKVIGEEKGGTLFVNLEPCSHYGKTPPCVDLIIERKLSTVVIGCRDNNPKVNGEGIKRLKKTGVNVVMGVLEKECRELNEVFFTDVEQKRTFVALKTATTIDGKIATKTGDSKWITSEKARNYSKKLRNFYDAVLTSSSTVIKDNPMMKHKLKIIIDKDIKTDFDSNIYKTGEIILVVGKDKKSENIILPDNVTVLKCGLTDDGLINLKDLTNKLYKLNIKSVFVEAGGILSGSFVKEGLVDTVYHFIAPKILNDNRAKSCFDGDNILKIGDCVKYRVSEFKKIENDVFVTYTKNL